MWGRRIHVYHFFFVFSFLFIAFQGVNLYMHEDMYIVIFFWYFFRDYYDHLVLVCIFIFFGWRLTVSLALWVFLCAFLFSQTANTYIYKRRCLPTVICMQIFFGTRMDSQMKCMSRRAFESFIRLCTYNIHDSLSRSLVWKKEIIGVCIFNLSSNSYFTFYSYI